MGLIGTDSDRLTRWLTHLEKDSLSPDGLLCFYDSPQSPTVAYSCEILGECFTNPVDDASH